MLFVFLFGQCCPIRFPYHMMFVSFNSNTTGNTSRAETAYISRTHVFIPHFVVFVLLNLSFSVSCVLERPLVEQKLLTFPEHMCSSRILWYSCCSIFRFLCRVFLSDHQWSRNYLHFQNTCVHPGFVVFVLLNLSFSL